MSPMLSYDVRSWMGGNELKAGNAHRKKNVTYFMLAVMWVATLLGSCDHSDKRCLSQPVKVQTSYL